MYLVFLESLKTPEHLALIEAAKTGFNILFESPHAETIDGRPIDLHVEDVLGQNGPVIALQYVKELINNIIMGNPLDVPHPGKGEVSHLDHPKTDFSAESLKNILTHLRLLENWLSQKTISTPST